MKRTIALLAIVMAAASCSSVKTAPVKVGDVCFRCRRTIVEPKLAAELVDAGGRAFKFRSAGCMATYLREHPEDKGTVFVTDFTTGRMLPARSATFVPTMVGQGRDRTREFVAYNASSDAREAAAREQSTTLDWAAVLSSDVMP